MLSYRETAALSNNQPEDIDSLTYAERAQLVIWIFANIQPARTVWHRTSYGLKHVFEHETGLYVTNGQFKGGMEACGFKTVDASEINWRYRARFTSSKQSAV